MGYWFINQFTPKDSKDTYSKSIYLTNDVKRKAKTKFKIPLKLLNLLILLNLAKK